MISLKRSSIFPKLERRRTARYNVCMETLMEVAGRTCRAVMLDIAPHGFRARISQDVSVGTQVVVVSEWLGANSATAIWSRGRDVGFCFQSALDAADLHYVLMQCARMMSNDEIEAYVEADPHGVMAHFPEPSLT